MHTNDQQADRLIEDMANDPRLLQLKAFTQHGKVSTYDHSVSVAKMSLKLARMLRLRVDSEQLVRGALLHDYYLYDWHNHGDKLHGYHHPDIAADKAGRDFALTQREQEIIRTHMWPLTLRRIPSSKEAALVCTADKLCSTLETIRGIWEKC